MFWCLCWFFYLQNIVCKLQYCCTFFILEKVSFKSTQVNFIFIAQYHKSQISLSVCSAYKEGVIYIYYIYPETLHSYMEKLQVKPLMDHCPGADRLAEVWSYVLCYSSREEVCQYSDTFLVSDERSSSWRHHGGNPCLPGGSWRRGRSRN